MDRPFKLDREGRPENLMWTVPAFVGRREELAWIEGCLQDTVAGHPRVVLMPGEAGIGKTRLLHEVRSIAVRRGLQVCYGRCYEELALPYLPFVEILRPYLEQLPEEMQQVLGADREILGQLLHYAGRPLSPAGLYTSAQTEQDKLQLFLAASHTITRLAQSHPMLFVMDDLHWADPSSLDLFGHLVFTVVETAVRESVPLLILGTYRPLEPEARLARLIARFQRESICQTLMLVGLSESNTHELVQGLGLVRASHQLIATINEATQGNPLFIQEVLHHLVQQDALQERGGYVVTTAASSDLQLPKDVTGAIATRIQGLSEGCQQILTLASFLGEGFSLQVLGALSRMSEEELLVLLEEGMHQRLLLSGRQAFQFVHSLVRHVFYHAPSTARRQRMHQQIAQTLEHLYADSLDEHILEIAHHLVRAGAAAEVATVVHYARRASDQALAVFAWDEAAYYYEAALSAAESTGHLTVHERAELHYWAGLAHYWNQDVGPCLDHYEKAIAAYRLSGDVRGLAQALIGKTHTQLTLAAVPLGALADLQPLEDVLAALGDNESGLQGHILAIMAEAYRQARQPAKAQEIAQRALEIGRGLKDDRLCARASSALALAHINGLHLREALECWQQALAYAQRANDLILQGWPLQRMPLALTLQGQLDKAETVALEACKLTRKTSDWGDYSVALSHLASIAVVRGDFAAAESRAHETMLMVYRSHYPWGGFRSLAALACARALRGAWVEAEDALDILVEPGHVFEDAGPIIKVFARVFRQLLRVQSQAVHEAVEPLATDLMRAVGTDTYSLGPLCALVELGDLMAAPAIAELPYRALSLAAERGVLFSSGWTFLIPRVLGVTATLNHWWDTAETHFHTAIAVATRVGARPELGRAYLDYARLLVARGTRSDRLQAIELVRQAGPLLLILGMQPLARRAAQLAEALQIRIPVVSQQHATYPDDLSTREVEVLLHIARGRTNQEIADDLILGPKTVADHVGSLITKIGVNGVEAATTYALEKGFASQSQPQKKPATPAALDSAVSAEEAQPLRIILVTDMESSTELIQRRGDEQAHELIRLHNTIIRACLRAYHGTEITHTGDGIEASFASAASAVECAMAIQQAFATHNQEHPTHPIHVRIGINAGEPILTEGRLFGTAVHMAFRICARAQPGQILISDVVHQLVAGKDFAFADRGRVVLRGFSGRLRLYEVQGQGRRA